MNYRESYGRSPEWWRQDKQDYIFNRHWMEVAAKADKDHVIDLPPKQSVEDSGLPYNNYGKVGLVLWHDANGQDILPVGLIGHKDGKTVFCYHPEYAADKSLPAISKSLPKNKLRHVWPPEDMPGELATKKGQKTLLPFFDNLVSEGALGMAQENACNVLKNIFKKYNGKDDRTREPYTAVADFEAADNAKHRFSRLLTFGRGFHGAVSVVDIAMPDKIAGFEQELTLQSMGTVGGRNPKSLGVKDGDVYKIAPRNADSGYILKFHNPEFRGPDIVNNEYLNYVATNILLQDSGDKTAEYDIASIDLPTQSASPESRTMRKETAFIVKRFDRGKKGRIHFEEALQMMGHPAEDKDEKSYEDLGKLTHALMGKEGVKKIYRRILAQLALGNTDGHLKNFAFWYERGDGTWDLTPNYDLVSSAQYSAYDENRRRWFPCDTLALKFRDHDHNHGLGELNAKRLLLLGEALGLSKEEAKTIMDDIKQKIPKAMDAIRQLKSPEISGHPVISQQEKDTFANHMQSYCNQQYGTLDRYWQCVASKRGGEGAQRG
ncbi:MAG: type II toxin-antitoxin system HipA family toxin [Alphaproteobacteria bacterium]|nr:type II toxin-antitoxin system HipA family toxin [Alphaproteobacteria bacterium]